MVIASEPDDFGTGVCERLPVVDAVVVFSHPAVELVTETDAGYELVTSYENAVQRLAALSNLVEPADEAVSDTT